MDYRKLADEINNDPAALVYAGKTNAQIAALLTGVTQATPRTIIPAHEVIEAIVSTEWAALTTAEKDRISMIIGAGTVNAGGTNTKAAFAAAFGAGTATRANLLALSSELKSRADVLGLGAVTAADVGVAKGGVW